jgi:hypothetical protein
LSTGRFSFNKEMKTMWYIRMIFPLICLKEWNFWEKEKYTRGGSSNRLSWRLMKRRCSNRADCKRETIQ